MAHNGTSDITETFHSPICYLPHHYTLTDLTLYRGTRDPPHIAHYPILRLPRQANTTVNEANEAGSAPVVINSGKCAPLIHLSILKVQN